jgi:hypothetical protein
MEHQGRLQRIEPLPAEFVRKGVEQGFVHQVALGAVGEQEPAPGNLPDLGFHSHRRSKAAEEQAARREDSPDSTKHRPKVLVVAGEVENRAADDDICKSIGKGHGFDRFGPEIGRRERGARAAAKARTLSTACGLASTPKTSNPSRSR